MLKLCTLRVFSSLLCCFFTSLHCFTSLRCFVASSSLLRISSSLLRIASSSITDEHIRFWGRRSLLECIKWIPYNNTKLTKCRVSRKIGIHLGIKCENSCEIGLFVLYTVYFQKRCFPPLVIAETLHTDWEAP